MDGRQKRVHKHPKVRSNNDVFALDESPRPLPSQRVQINKVVPINNNPAQFSVNNAHRDRSSSNDDPMVAIQRRIMQQRDVDKIRMSQENRIISENDEIKVLPIKKKVLSKNPGSSPEQRSGIEGIDYVYNGGKAALMQKRDIKLKQAADIYGAEQGSGGLLSKKGRQPRLERGNPGLQQYQSNPLLPGLGDPDLSELEDQKYAANHNSLPEVNSRSTGHHRNSNAHSN